MANFSRLEELVVAANSRGLFNGMLVYFERENRNDLEFANGLFPTGRVVVPTGRYVVLAGKVIIIVSLGRLSLVPTGRVLSPEELAVVADSRFLFDGMLVYFERETAIDLEFEFDLHNLWVSLIDCTNDRKTFITELEGVPPSMMSYNCCVILYKV
ncbi:hypothetical protein Tco_0396922 [Tanacetum coccineum]